MLDILGVRERELSVKYLGVPLFANKIMDRECSELISKIRGKLQGWSSRLLSFAGRIELVHIVIQEKVNFWLQTFHLPDASNDKIKRVFA